MNEIQQPRNKKFQDGGRPAAYLAFLPGLYKRAEELGYNLCVHGSLCRDFDLVAIAWVYGAVPAEEFIESIATHVGGKVQDSLDCDAMDFTKRGAEPKMHGRYAWTIHMGGGPMLDISVVGPEADAIQKSFARMDESRARFEAAKVLVPFTKPTQKVRELATSLFTHIKHGDQEHQEWLERESLLWCAANFGDEPARKPDPKIEKLDDLVARALQEPTLMAALSFASTWDTERAVDQAKREQFKTWETTSLFLFNTVSKAWAAREEKQE